MTGFHGLRQGSVLKLPKSGSTFLEPGRRVRDQGGVAVGAFVLRIVAQNEVMNPSRNVHVYLYIDVYKIIYYILYIIYYILYIHIISLTQWRQRLVHVRN